MYLLLKCWFSVAMLVYWMVSVFGITLLGNNTYPTSRGFWVDDFSFPGYASSREGIWAFSASSAFMTGDSCGLLQICLGVWWLSLMKCSHTLLASPWFRGRYRWPTSQGCYSRSPRVLRHYVMSCFLKTKARFACFTISGKTDVLFWFQSECHLDMSFIFFDFHAMETSGYVDVMLLRRQEEPTERTFDELLDHLEASLMQAGPTEGGFFVRKQRGDYMDVSENSGTPKSSILIGFFHYFHHPFWGTPIFGNTHIDF